MNTRVFILLILAFCIFFFSWRRCWEIKWNFSEAEKKAYEKYRKIYNILCITIVIIFIIALVVCIILEKHYHIESILWFGTVWFSWVILLFLWLLVWISQYLILHNITKKR